MSSSTSPMRRKSKKKSTAKVLSSSSGLQQIKDEKKIPQKYKTDDGFLFLNFFEVRKPGGEIASVEDHSVEALHFSGYLIEPQNVPKTEKSSSEDFDKSYQVALPPSKQWAFDYSDENKGVWIQTVNEVWVKLLHPSSLYAPHYKTFKEKCDLWLTLFEVIGDRENPSYDYVLQKMEKRGYDKAKILENGNFICQRCVIEDDNLENNEDRETPYSQSKFVNKLVEILKELKILDRKIEKTLNKKRKKVKKITKSSTSDNEETSKSTTKEKENTKNKSKEMKNNNSTEDKKRKKEGKESKQKKQKKEKYAERDFVPTTPEDEDVLEKYVVPEDVTVVRKHVATIEDDDDGDDEEVIDFSDENLKKKQFSKTKTSKNKKLIIEEKRKKPSPVTLTKGEQISSSKDNNTTIIDNNTIKNNNTNIMKISGEEDFNNVGTSSPTKKRKNIKIEDDGYRFDSTLREEAAANNNNKMNDAADLRYVEYDKLVDEMLNYLSENGDLDEYSNKLDMIDFCPIMEAETQCDECEHYKFEFVTCKNCYSQSCRECFCKNFKGKDFYKAGMEDTYTCLDCLAKRRRRQAARKKKKKPATSVSYATDDEDWEGFIVSDSEAEREEERIKANDSDYMDLEEDEFAEELIKQEKEKKKHEKRKQRIALRRKQVINSNLFGRGKVDIKQLGYPSQSPQLRQFSSTLLLDKDWINKRHELVLEKRRNRQSNLSAIKRGTTITHHSRQEKSNESIGIVGGSGIGPGDLTDTKRNQTKFSFINGLKAIPNSGEYLESVLPKLNITKEELFDKLAGQIEEELNNYMNEVREKGVEMLRLTTSNLGYKDRAMFIFRALKKIITLKALCENLLQTSGIPSQNNQNINVSTGEVEPPVKPLSPKELATMEPSDVKYIGVEKPVAFVPPTETTENNGRKCVGCGSQNTTTEYGGKDGIAFGKCVNCGHRWKVGE
ncbi:hypothetical protein ABK040_012015 [Willaertia magna]